MPTLEELEAKYFPPTVGIHHPRDTQVITHVDGQSYFAALHDAIAATNSADDVIYNVSWFIQKDFILKTGTSELGTLLHDKAALGVDVRIIVWTGRFVTGKAALDDAGWWNEIYAGSAESHRAGLVGVVQHNINTVQELRLLNPTKAPKPPLQERVLMDYGGDALGSRHQKYTIVYRKSSNDLRAFVGGLDLFGDRMAAPHHTPGFWHDAGVELRAGAAASVWADFRTRWVEAQTLPTKRFRQRNVPKFFNDPAIPTQPTVPAPPAHQIASTNSVRVVKSYWPFREDPFSGPDLPWVTIPAQGLQEVLRVYQKALTNATNFIYIEDQWLNFSDRLIGHETLFPLVVAAVNRGVKVILIVPGTGDPADPDNMENKEQSKSFIQNFRVKVDLRHNTDFVMYRINAAFVHSKVLLIDDQFVAIGSANFADRSMDGRDTELQAAIVDAGTLISDFRVHLWADHLHVDPNDPAITAELRDLSKSLGIFRPEWITGSGVTFPHPNSKLHRVD
jgi:phosphatidylserine/phosphatidylglycerophosphate/cardiolipin synthase-like enzyme